MFARIEAVGLSRTTVEDVARTAALSRQTIYRYFPSKDHLILALVLREEERFLDGARDAFEAAPDLGGAIRGSILFCLRFAREHPLLDRLLADDAETFLPFLTTRGAPVIARARETFTRLVLRRSWVRADVVEQLADTAARVVVSYALSPPDRDPETVATDLARIMTIALTGKEASRR